MGPAVSHPPIQPDALRRIMRRHRGEVDACIVGSGAAGAVLAKELAEAGSSVVVLEAGEWLDTRQDYVNDELSMLGRFDWDDPRITDGADPLRLGRVNTGRAVGGTTVHWAGAALRFQDHEWKARSTYGDIPGANLRDWPVPWYSVTDSAAALLEGRTVGMMHIVCYVRDGDRVIDGNVI